jgi:hypothetical protein
MYTDSSSKMPQNHQQILTSSLIESWTVFEIKLKSKKQGTLVLLPLMIMSIRVAVEEIFRKNYPLWFSVGGESVARKTLQDMNEVITSLFDPDGYHSHISTIESSNQALRVSSKSLHHSQSTLRYKYDYTSKLVRSIFTKPTSGDSRILVTSKKLEHIFQSSNTLPPREGTTEAFMMQRKAANEAVEHGECPDDLTIEQRLQLYKLALKKVKMRYSSNKKRKPLLL